MSYKTILVYLNSEEQAARIMSVAAQVARRSNAHLIGLYVVPAVRIYPAVQAYITTEILEAQKQHYREQADRIRKVFDTAVSGEDFVSEWRVVEAHVPDRTPTVLQHGRMVDLIVLGQYDQSEERDERDLPDRVVLEGGRPVLIVPAAGKFENVGDYVMLAWDGSREASRAAFDAMPFLETADEVRVHAVNPPSKEGNSTFLPGTELSASLARHGVKAETGQSTSRSGAVGEEILSRMADHGSNLLVMGCYGHSKLRELALGGVTRHITQHMTAPVLFSH